MQVQKLLGASERIPDILHESGEKNSEDYDLNQPKIQYFVWGAMCEFSRRTEARIEIARAIL